MSLEYFLAGLHTGIMGNGVAPSEKVTGLNSSPVTWSFCTELCARNDKSPHRNDVMGKFRYFRSISLQAIANFFKLVLL